LKTNRGFRASIISAFLIVQATAGTVLPQSTSFNSSGFTSPVSAEQRHWEEEFRSVPAPNSAREHLRRLTAEPHVAGTKEDYATALYVRDQIRSYGIAAELNEYEVLLPYPKQPAIVELIRPRRERLAVKEAVVPEDPSSSNPKIIPLFNGYSPSGDVTAPLVYVNYGLPPDYEALKKLGVDVTGKIVIARYGNSFRGVKAKVAQEHGAVRRTMVTCRATFIRRDHGDRRLPRSAVQYNFCLPRPVIH
jgi:N-acetylated-alpha-linked acidic dipeptidase